MGKFLCVVFLFWCAMAIVFVLLAPDTLLGVLVTTFVIAGKLAVVYGIVYAVRETLRDAIHNK